MNYTEKEWNEFEKYLKLTHGEDVFDDGDGHISALAEELLMSIVDNRSKAWKNPEPAPAYKLIPATYVPNNWEYIE